MDVMAALNSVAPHLAVIGLIVLISALAGGIRHISRREDREVAREEAGGAPPAATPEPQPPSSMYGRPVLVLTPNDYWKRWFQLNLPGVKVVAQGDPGWEGLRLKDDDYLVIYRKEVNDAGDTAEVHRDDLLEPEVPG